MEEDTLDVAGWFWLPDNPDRKFTGHLTYTATDGGELTLYARVGEHEHLLEHDAGRYRVVGSNGQTYFTLESCFPRNTEIFGAQQRLSVGVVIKGAAFEPAEPLVFTEISFEVDNGLEWVETTAVHHDVPHDTTSEFGIRVQPISSDEVATAFGSVKLFYGWSSFGGQLAESGVRQNRRFYLTPSSPMELDDLLTKAAGIQNLITLAVGRPCLMHSVRLAHADLNREREGREPVPERLELFFQNRSGTPTFEKPRHAWELLFTYGDIGGIAGVGKWADVVERYQTVVDSLLSLQYGQRLYLENRLQNAVHAAEILHRLRFSNELRPKAEFKSFKRKLVGYVPRRWRTWLHNQLQYSNEPRLSARLRELVTFAGPVAEALVGDVDAWTAEVRDVRNGLVHYPGERRGTAESTRMYYLTQSLYFVVALALLRECDVPDEVYAKVESNATFSWVAERLANSDADA